MTRSWFTYILLCSDATLYTGVTTDITRRLQEHNSQQGGARYTRCRKPVQLVFVEQQASRAQACQRESAIKKLSAAAKRQLIGEHLTQDNVPPTP